MAKDSEKLGDTYNELWKVYQNQETVDIEKLTYDELEERITKWESIEFEARAKRQKDLAEKRNRDFARAKGERDSLISDPKFTPSLIREGKLPKYSVKPDVKKVKAQRVSKEDKLKNTLSELGVDLGDMLKDIQSKKNSSLKDGMDTLGKGDK